MSETAKTATDGHAIGEAISSLRTRLGMTLEQLSSLTGFTKGYLSKIENAKKVPPIGSLSRIARALKTDITELLKPAPGQPAAQGQSGDSGFCVVRAADRQPAMRGGSAFGYDYVSLATGQTARKMEPFLFTFPSEIDKYVFFEHEGEEFLFVLTGKVEWQAGGSKLILEAGDSIYFNARLPHRGCSLGGEASALVVVYSPEQHD
jgi:transcriptional regulator with XRE-family HTH domain